MDDFVVSNPERVRIFQALCENKRLHFNELKRRTDIASNKLSYQLTMMKERDFVLLEDGHYTLTAYAQQLIPYFSQILKKEVGVLPVVLGIVRHGNDVLLIKRKKMPYKGYWGIIGGKQINGETIPQTIEREVFEEARLRASFSVYNGVAHERVFENDSCKHSFLFIITTLTAETTEICEQNEGKVAWFSMRRIIDDTTLDIIPSDREFLKKYAKKTIEIEHVMMHEEAETITLVQQ